jgi:hypothetical protein
MRVRMAEYVARMAGKNNVYRLLVGNPEGKRQLGRPRCKWVDNIELDLREVGWDRRIRLICLMVATNRELL